MQELEKHGPLVLAVDIGGTKIITALVTTNGKVIAKERHLTLASEGPQPVINRLLSGIDHLLASNGMEASQLDSIGIAAAGAIDLKRGIITLSPNLRGWTNIPLRDIVLGKYHINTALINDASAAALGEYQFGAGKEASNLIFITVGTGIGGGIIINRELYSGPFGSAGEIGHMTIDINGDRCPCGNIGCLELMASGRAMARAAKERISNGETSSLVKMAESKIENITGEMVGVAAQSGDPLALDVVTRAAGWLGVGMVNLTNIFNPEMIVVGGGVAKLGAILLEPARRVVMERAFPVSAHAVRIVTAQLGEEAGLYGAAIFALRQKVR